jgi:hypothetical protein
MPRHAEYLFRRIAWRLQALAEGDLTENARERARQIACDADLRIVTPEFTVAGTRVETTDGDRNRREQNSRRLPLSGTLLSRKWKGRAILAEVLPNRFRYPKSGSSTRTHARRQAGRRGPTTA